MTMLSYNYKKLKEQRFLILVIAVLLFALAVLKLGTIYYKIRYMNQGEKLYKENSLVLSEEYFQKSNNIKHFDYKNELINNRLTELAHVTETKAKLKALSRRALPAGTKNNISELLDIYNTYNADKAKIEKQGNEAEHKIFVEAADFYEMEDNIETAFFDYKNRLLKDMRGKIGKNDFKDKNFKSNLLSIPAEYYGDEEKKHGEIEGYYKEYDHAMLSHMFKNSPYSGILDEAVKIIQANKQHKMDSSWVEEEMLSYLKGVFGKDKASGSYRDFADHAAYYESCFQAEFNKSKRAEIKGLLKQYTDGFLEDGWAYINGKEYAKAIDLYEALAGYKDTGDLIKEAQIKWIEEEPQKMLVDKYGNKMFDNMNVIKDKWDSGVSVIASDVSGGMSTLILCMQKRDASIIDMSAEVFNDGTSIKGITVKSEYNESYPFILAEGTSDLRNSKYVLYQISEDGFKEIFRAEADNLALLADSTIEVSNPIGQFEGLLSYYQPADGYYRLSFVEIKGYKDLMDHIQSKPEYGFIMNLNIVDVIEGTDKALSIINESLDDPYGDRYIILEHSGGFKTGNTVVAGYYTGDEQLYIDSEYLKIIPKVKVTKIGDGNH